MRSELFRATITLAIVGVCGGCAQATRHSNTMIFGTNTVVGLKVGANATSVPSIELGYNRQEAVIMPLVANVSADGKLLSPCDVGSTITAPSRSHNSVHPCLLVGINGSASDSYSVLASFGASFDSSVSQADGKAKGGLAQYFATGMAAQLLALNGGASVVAVGEAAVKAAENRPANGENKALFSNPAAFS